jgi:hypothetical protein
MLSSKELVLRPGMAFNGVKVFSATMHRDRDVLGENVTRWMADHPRSEVVSIVMAQSSDASFHCVTCAVFFRA